MVNLAELPPEIFISHLVHYLPLESIASLALSCRDFSYLSLCKLSNEPSIAPWRRRYFAHKRAYQKSYIEAEDRAYDLRFSKNGGAAAADSTAPPGSVVTGTQVLNKTALEREYEALTASLFADLGLFSGNTTVGTQDSLLDTQKFPLIAEHSVYCALDAIILPDRQRDIVLRLPTLRCSLSRLVAVLERSVTLDIVEIFACTTLLPAVRPPEGSLQERAIIYRLLAAYLLYSEMTPLDLNPILRQCVPSGLDAGIVEMDNLKALVEFFCFLGTVLDMWEAQVHMLRDAPLECGDVTSIQTRRVLKKRLQTWVANFFRVQRPFLISTREQSCVVERRVTTFPSSLPPPTSNRQVNGLQRSYSDSMVSADDRSSLLQQKPAFKPTHEQQKIIETKVRPGDLMKIMAFAGTGKTSVLMRYAKEYTEQFPGTRVLYVAFNASARQDAFNSSREIGAYKIDCEDALLNIGRAKLILAGKTFHSCCHKAVTAVAPHLQGAMSNLNNFFGSSEIVKLLNLDDNLIGEALVNPSLHAHPRVKKQNLDGKMPFPSPTSVAIRVKSAFENFCNSAELEITWRCLPTKLLDKMGLKHSAVLRWVERLWKGMTDGTDPYMTHDCYSKVVCLAASRMPEGQRNVGEAIAFGRYDVIMYDEAQVCEFQPRWELANNTWYALGLQCVHVNAPS